MIDKPRRLELNLDTLVNGCIDLTRCVSSGLATAESQEDAQAFWKDAQIVHEKLLEIKEALDV